MNESRGSVLVTGSSRGIGAAIATRLAQDGFDLVLHCRSQIEQAQALADTLAAEHGNDCRVLQFDVAQRAAAQQAIADDLSAHGAYFGVVCNAGIAADNAFPALTAEEWDSVVHTNLDAFYIEDQTNNTTPFGRCFHKFKVS